MPAFLSITCSRAEAQKLSLLLATLSRVFGKYGGVLLERQGPASGFHDPLFGGMAEIRVYRFPDTAHVQQALEDPGFAATQVLRSSFVHLDISTEPAD